MEEAIESFEYKSSYNLIKLVENYRNLLQHARIPSTDVGDHLHPQMEAASANIVRMCSILLVVD